MQRRDPDALTPREQEVLDLLKRGYSNRDIAAELQISLCRRQVPRFGDHLQARRVIARRGGRVGATGPGQWILLPVFRSHKHGLLTAGLTLKLALGLAAASAVAIVMVAFVGGYGSATDDAPPAASQPSPTPDFPCPRPGESCVRILHIGLASWDEAASFAAAPLLEPTYIPTGYERDKLTYSYSDSPTDQVGLLTSIVSSRLIGPEGEDLLVNQGYGPSLGNDAFTLAPDQFRGTIVVNGTELMWVRGNPLWEERADGWHATEEWDLDSLNLYTLTWQEPKTGPIVWEKSPDGEVTYRRSGDAVGYLIYATGLPLEELLKVAESMLQD